MRTAMFNKTTATFGVAALMVFGTTACATKKYVRTTVSPVEARVTTTEKKVADHSSAISELENNVSHADEKATEAGKNAGLAQQAADRANQAALEARNRADSANSMGEQNASKIGAVDQKNDQKFANLDNYQLVSTEAVLFPLGKSTLTKDAKQQLDQMVDQIKGNKNYVVEVRGFTDKTGSVQSNIVLSQKRADEVVRYLTTEHDIQLRKIHVLGAGVDTADPQKTRADRQQARKVEMKVYTLNLENKPGQSQASSGQTGDQADNQMRSRTPAAPAKNQ
jgi:outer membrane protein OmpA-like peptidoglycan-associated protein